MNEHFQNNITRILQYGGYLVLVLIVFVAILSINALKDIGSTDQNEAEQNTIVVRGEGEAFAVPDVARFTYAVVEQGNTVSEAQELATEKWNSILEYLEDEGIAEEDVKTIGFNISPVYERQSSNSGFRPPEVDREIVGYTVRQTAEVKVRDTENVGAVLSGVGERDVRNLSGLSLTVEDEEEVRAQARTQAIEHAREKAESLARALDVRLGDVVGFQESNVFPYSPRGLGMEFADEAMEEGTSTPEIPMGENRIVVDVEVTFQIN